MSLQVATNVVRVDANEVAETMRHEHSAQSARKSMVSISNFAKTHKTIGHYVPVLDHLVHFASQQTSGQQTLQNHTFGQKMHVHPADAWLQRSTHRHVSIENGIVDDRLLLAELTATRVRASDVAGEAEVFASHVQQAHVVLA